jgi:plasmid stability protein
MTDILVRNLPEEVVAQIDAQAASAGLSRAEYVRRQLVREATRLQKPVHWHDLVASDRRLSDLLDEEVMDRAWR